MNKQNIIFTTGLFLVTSCATVQSATLNCPTTACTAEKIFLSGSVNSPETRTRLRTEAASIMRKKGYTKWEIVKIEKAYFPLTAADYTIKYSK